MKIGMRWGVVATVLALAVVALGYRSWRLEDQLERQAAQLAAQKARLDALSDRSAPPATPKSDLEDRFAELEARLTSAHQPRDKAPQKPKPAIAGLAKRQEATQEAEAERQSAVLEALESYNPQIRDRFRALVQEEQDVLRKERQAQRREQWSARLRDRIDKMARAAKLSSSQSAQIFTLVQSEHDQVVVAFRKARQDGSWGQAHKTGRKLRKETDETVRALVDDDEQYAAYEELRAEDRRHGRRDRDKKKQKQKE